MTAITRFSLLIFLLAETTVLASAAVAQPETDDDPAAQQILAHLNAWRLEAGVPPLKPNDTLVALALAQAVYLSTLTDIPGGNAMHLGPDGETPRERAVQPPFNWPSYGGGATGAAIAEVGMIGRSESALEFWRRSEIHTRTITHPGMREVGVAAVPHQWGHIYIVVLGSRPDVLPALFDPRSQQLYLTQDVWKYGPGFVPPMQIRFLDENGDPLTDWQDWQPSLPLPEGVSSRFYVQYHDGSREITTEVDLERDYIILPEYLPPAP
ncbi:MAG: hypothetical protein HZC41_06450 [Chloroflexi bacterium]|nr:hypothetical protein [Chloroflexota bacterium]